MIDLHNHRALRIFAFAAQLKLGSFMNPLLLLFATLLSVAASHLVSGAEPFPEPFNTETATTRPMPAAEAAAQVQLPHGFHCTAFAAEPDVRQPIAMTTDARGRLWVAENYTYAERPVVFDERLRDRIVIFEDTDNDGRFDKRTVFWEGAQRLTSLEVGLGGVWALCLPQLLFIPDRNGDDVPDAKPEVMLDGFEFTHARHTVANGLRWGPDGWLYGRQGISGTSLVGKPGAPGPARRTVNAGIWRYHPVRRAFEVVAVGTTNPWGMDWDAHGEPFFINTVIGHLWHLIPGAHYRRMTGEDLGPRVYEVIEQHADHFHWATGEAWTDVRKGATDATLAAGGGHAHTGLLIYQGGQWPAEWMGKLLTINFHGRRCNVERLERAGSGFVGRHDRDAFLFADPWFRGIDLIAAPDGGVFVSDWSDTGECHDQTGIHRTSGRIFKITYGEPKPRSMGNLAELGGAALVQCQLSDNAWLARQARRVLADHAVAGQDQTEPCRELTRMVAQETDAVHRLRALWALHVMNASDPRQLTALLSDRDEHVRAWALRLLEDQSHAAESRRAEFSTLARETLPALAARETSALVRLALASLLQKLPPPERPALAAALLGHGEDAADHNLPQMLWLGLMPLVELSDASFEKLVAAARIPRVQRFGARRLAEKIDTAPERLNALLTAVAELPSLASRRAVLDGLADGLSGRRLAPKPAAWDALQAKLSADGEPAMRDRVRDLSAIFGDARALEAIRAAALNPASSLVQRRAALQALIEVRGPGLRETCEQLLSVRELSTNAASGLSLFDGPAIADRLLAEWPTLSAEEKNPVFSVLVSRPAWAAKALDAVAEGRVERERLSAVQARQIRGYADPALIKRLNEVLGQAPGVASADKAALLAKWKQRLTPDALATADKAKGRVVFQSVCAACHRLNGEGGVVGPDLTGAARDNLDYLLDNILFPSAVVADQFRLVALTLKDGRVLAGFGRGRTGRTLKLQTMTELISLEAAEVAKQETSALSLMPDGLLEALDGAQVRDLLTYLMSKETPTK